jgi:AcrR family transcriptional regulator
MPRKITVTKQQVLDAAYEIVRTRGRDALSARSAAQALGCSTQPIYRAYGAMAELHQDVFERASDKAIEYMSSGDPEEGSPFLAMGYGTLRLAQEEPHLFRLIMGSAQAARDLIEERPPPPVVLEGMRAVPELAALSDERLQRIHALLWLFSQGVASLFFVETDADPMPRARAYLEQAGRAVIHYELEGAVR